MFWSLAMGDATMAMVKTGPGSSSPEAGAFVHRHGYGGRALGVGL